MLITHHRFYIMIFLSKKHVALSMFLLSIAPILFVTTYSIKYATMMNLRATNTLFSVTVRANKTSHNTLITEKYTAIFLLLKIKQSLSRNHSRKLCTHEKNTHRHPYGRQITRKRSII